MTCELIYHESWRSEAWGDDLPGRPGWQVKCSEHGLLGSPRGWAYAKQGIARATATRHMQRRHAALACGHDPALAQFARDGRNAWCYVCEQHVDVRRGQP